MRQAVLRSMVDLAQKAGPIGGIVKTSIHGKGATAYVSADDALEKLRAAGYVVEIEPGKAKDGAWVRVLLNDELKAQGYSGAGKQDAMLQALFGAVREENAALVVAEELKTLPEGIRDKLTDYQVGKLESLYAVQGMGRLRAALGK